MAVIYIHWYGIDKTTVAFYQTTNTMSDLRLVAKTLLLIELLEPIVVESIYPVAISKPSMMLATVDYLPNQAFVQPWPIGLAPTVSLVPSNLTMVFVPLVFVVVVSALALVLRRASRSSQGGEVVEVIPLPDQTEQGTISPWVFKCGAND